MQNALLFLASGVISFWAHHVGEKLLTKGNKRMVRLVIRNYQIHHSTYGLLAIFASIFTGGYALFILFGFGVGNIWQHKHTHNKINEKGMVFVTKSTQVRSA